MSNTKCPEGGESSHHYQNRISVTCRRQGVSQRVANNNNNNTASWSMQQRAAKGGDKAPRQSHARALAISRYMHQWWRS